MRGIKYPKMNSLVQIVSKCESLRFVIPQHSTVRVLYEAVTRPLLLFDHSYCPLTSCLECSMIAMEQKSLIRVLSKITPWQADDSTFTDQSELATSSCGYTTTPHWLKTHAKYHTTPSRATLHHHSMPESSR